MCIPSHCLHHLLPDHHVSDNLLLRGHGFQLPTHCTVLHRNSFVTRSLFLYVWFLMCVCLISSNKRFGWSKFPVWETHMWEVAYTTILVTRMRNTADEGDDHLPVAATVVLCTLNENVRNGWIAQSPVSVTGLIHPSYSYEKITHMITFSSLYCHDFWFFFHLVFMAYIHSCLCHVVFYN